MHVDGYLAVDAGGTGTRVLLVDGDGGDPSVAEFGPVNPISVGATRAAETWSRLFGWTTQHTEGDLAAWLAHSAVAESSLATEHDRIVACARSSGFHGLLCLSNDVLPLLFEPPLAGEGIVIVSGTGSGAIGRSAERVVTVGGAEYLGSDEGSGFDLGRRGLQAAVRAADGRGPSTALEDMACDTYGGPSAAAVARSLAQQPHPKTDVARFGAAVLNAWDDGDDAAADIVASAIAALLMLGRAAIERLAADQVDIVLTGGVLTGCTPLAERLTDGLRAVPRVRSVTVRHPLDAILAAARRLPDSAAIDGFPIATTSVPMP